MSNCPTNGGSKLDQGSGNCKGPVVNVKAAAPQPIACASTGGTRATDDWSTEITLCEVATGTEGCSAGDDCVPAGEPICVVQEGQNLADCPNGWGQPLVVFADADDKLQCNACICTPSYQCPGGYLGYDGDFNICVSGGTTIPPDTCVSAEYVGYVDRPATGDMSCIQSGGGMTGTFMPTNPTTICCKTP
jgi:hypothetical protein